MGWSEGVGGRERERQRERERERERERDVCGCVDGGKKIIFIHQHKYEQALSHKIQILPCTLSIVRPNSSSKQ